MIHQVVIKQNDQPLQEIERYLQHLYPQTLQAILSVVMEYAWMQTSTYILQHNCTYKVNR